MCRFLPQYRARGEADLARGFLAGGAVAALASAGAAAAAGAALLWLAGGSLGEDRLLPLALALATVPVFAVQDYLQAVARSQNWPVLAILPPYIVRQGLVGAARVAACRRTRSASISPRPASAARALRPIRRHRRDRAALRR